VRPIGAQLSTRVVVFFGANFVCAQAGEAIKRIANTSFFIGLSPYHSASTLDHGPHPRSNRLSVSRYFEGCVEKRAIAASFCTHIEHLT
jgi:hypothetical protein